MLTRKSFSKEFKADFLIFEGRMQFERMGSLKYSTYDSCQ